MLTKKTRVPAKKKGVRKNSAKPRKQPSQERSRETVAVILEAAARVLEQRGLDGYNTNAVAEKAGVSIGSLYQYFPNKDAMTVALILHFENDLQQSVQDAMPGAEHLPLPQALRRVVRALYGAHVRRASLHRLLEAEEQRLRMHVPQSHDTLRLLVRRLLQPHRAMLRVPWKEAVPDCITLALAMVDEALQQGISPAAAERRTVQALCGYLLWEGIPARQGKQSDAANPHQVR